MPALTESDVWKPDIIETTDEEGQVHIFERIDEIEVESQRYALLLYQGSRDESGAPKALDEGYDEEFVAMRVVTDEDGSDYFEVIDNDEEFDRVVKYIEAHQDELGLAGTGTEDAPE